MRGGEEFEATVFNIRYRSDEGWCVLGCSPVPKGNEYQHLFVGDSDTVTVTDESQEIQAGQSYRFWGRWTHHVKYGRQFKAETFISIVPFTRNGIMKYLQRCVGIGPAVANKLWRSYGPDAVRMLREEPERVVKAGYLTKSKADAAAAKLAEDAKLEGITIDLIDLLHGRQFPKRVYKLAIDTWGNRACEVIRQNPLVLCDFPGVGFKRPDRLYLDLGHPPDALERQMRCLTYLMEKGRDGHTWFRAESTSVMLKELIAATKVRPIDAVKKGLELGRICKHRDEQGRLWLAPADYAADEVAVANVVGDLLQHESCWPEIRPETGASDHQIEQWNRCRAGRVAILQGKPGTGKTWLSAQIIKAIVEQFGEGDIAVAAPTGRAAVRLTEAMRANRVDVIARTVHRLLGVRRSGRGGSNWEFAHGTNEPLPYRFVLVDEFSMQSTDMTARLFEALAPDAHLLMVGDPAQLPPVGHGAPLRDMLAADVPQACLEEIVRQDNPGTIIAAAAAIREGYVPRTDQQLNPAAGHNFKHIETDSSDEAADRIVGLVQVLPGIDPVWDAQVIVAVNEGSPCGRKNLNERLQQVLNPTGQKVAGCKFWIGDKVVCLENSFVKLSQPRLVMNESLEFLGLAWPCDESDVMKAYRQLARVHHPDAGGTDKAFVRLQRHFDIARELIASGYEPSRETVEVLVCNGEIGQVIEITDGEVVMRFTDPERVIRVPRKSSSDDNGNGGSNGDGNGDGAEANGDSDSSEGGSLKKFDLGYAVTCHKYQGSEIPVVIIAVDDSTGARMTTCREWIYTAITRAKTACITVGQWQQVSNMIDRVKLGQRKTFLKELIQSAPKPEPKREPTRKAPKSACDTTTNGTGGGYDRLLNDEDHSSERQYDGPDFRSSIPALRDPS